MKLVEGEHQTHTVQLLKGSSDDPNNVTEIVVPSDMCIGCGVCAALCPNQCLSIRLNDYGEFKPELVGTCRSKCNLCLRVCPFYQGSVTLDSISANLYGHIRNISRDKNLGYYLSSWVGYSPGHRQRSASGGMATWLLEELLSEKAVDRVICVVPDNSKGLISKASILSSVEEVRKAAGSRYHPVELSQVLMSVRNDDDYRYAITGLPCFLHAVRLASQYDRRLAHRIRFLLGLVCGHCPGFFYTEALLSLTGHTIASCQSVDYRSKQKTDYAGNFRFRVLDRSGIWSRSIPFIGIPSFLWSNMYFTSNPCNFCDDVFAEVADAVFMDAWLPQYSKNPEGTSIVVTRNPELNDLIVSGRRSRSCCLDPIPISEVVRSQEELVYQKKMEVGARIAWAMSRGRWLPPMRIAPNHDLYNSDPRHTDLRMSIITSSKRLWPYFCWLRSQAIWPFLVVSWVIQGRKAIRLQQLRNIMPVAWLIQKLLTRFMKLLKNVNRFIRSQG